MNHEHSPFSNYDLAAITNSFTTYKAAGLQANYDVRDQASGIVSIAFENPVLRDGSIVVFEVHKLTKPGRFFGKSAHWVVQLYEMSPSSVAREKKGCLAASTQTGALHAAEMDLKHGFVGIADFDLAAAGY